jgi:hypothetical protein
VLYCVTPKSNSLRLRMMYLCGSYYSGNYVLNNYIGTSLQVLETVKTLEMRTRLLSACCSCLSIMAFIMLRFHADIFLKCVFKLFVQFISEDQIIKYLRFHFLF